MRYQSYATPPLHRRGKHAREARSEAATRHPASESGAPSAPYSAVSDEALRAAAERVSGSCKALEGGSIGRTEVLRQLDVILAAAEDRLHEGASNGGPRDVQAGVQNLRCRLLERLRGEVIREWSAAASPPDPHRMVALLAALERVREQIEPEPDDVLATRMAGPDGLSLLVELAHDLRSPLTSILFLADPLRKGQSGEVNDLQRRQLGIVYSAAFGLLCMTSDVIELVRGRDGLMQMQRIPFSVTEILNSVGDIVQPLAEEKGLAIRLLPPEDDLRVGCPTPLSRVLLNLTTNALKYTEEGFVEIVARSTGPDTVEFSVRDTGEGLTAEALDRLYQPFRQEPGRKSAHFCGTGLGLSICQKLVEAMDSEIHVDTRAGWGTRFFFEMHLPPADRV